MKNIKEQGGNKRCQEIISARHFRIKLVNAPLPSQAQGGASIRSMPEAYPSRYAKYLALRYDRG